MEIKRINHTQFDWDVCKVMVDTDFIELASVQDIHRGSPGFKQHSFEKLVEYIYLNKVLWILNGDAPDNATKSSVASTYESTENPNDQFKYMTKTLEVIKDTCLGIIEGNHERRTKRHSDFDMSEAIADFLGVEYYGPEMYFIISKRTETGGVAYGGYANHSNSSSKTAGLDANSIYRDWMPWNEGIDIFIKGHTHHPHVTPAASACMDFQNMCVRQKNRWLYNAGSFMARPKGYAGVKPYGLQPSIYYTLKLDMRKKMRAVKSVEAITHCLES